jgi:tetratricopeptide (TPR) repeat protein
LRPDSFEARRLLARLELAALHPGESERLWREALAIQPHSAAAHRGLGDVFYARGELAAALEQWRVALQEDPSLPDLAPLVEDVQSYLLLYGDSAGPLQAFPLLPLLPLQIRPQSEKSR